MVGIFYELARRMGETRTSLVRTERFLLLEELNTSSNVQRPSEAPEGGETCFLQLDKVTAKWDQNPDVKNTLENISLKVEAGQLTAVIGPVGSGKSSLLMCLLGELPADSGAVTVSGKIAYLSQQPWIFSGSVRQNIVFGGVFDKSKYDKIVKVSALKRDFEIMPQGDATLIGDRGVSLSGGQKARVALARALYMDADIYLLDDPLSAVDSAVGRHIFERCIVKYLKNKPRILVTHQVQYLPVADSIFIIKEGKIESQGSFEELSQSGVDFAELLKVAEDEEPVSPTSITVTEVMKPCFPESQEFGSHKSLHSMVDEYEPEAVQLPEEEERGLGTVGFQVYVEYFKAGTGIIKFIVLVMVNIAAQVFYVGSDWWLSQWSNDEEEKFAAINRQKLFLAEHNISSLDMNSSISSNITIPYVDSHFKIYVFTSIILAVFIFGLLRALLFFKITVDAAQCLHNRMFSRLLRSPISFFDTNPVGRILNRFSKDVGHMDDLLPLTFFDFVQCGLLILGIVLVAGVVNPYVFIVTVPLAVGFVFLRRYYLQTSRSIKRLEGTTRSPVFSYLSASLLGLHTIRSMKMEDKFMEEFDSHQDRHSEAWFLFLATSRWLAVRLDGLCAIFVTVVTFCSILAVDTMNAGLVGLSVTYTMTLMGMFQWGVRQSAEVENQMISVERVLEYTCLPMEAEVESEPDKKPPPSWPPSGIIECSGLSLQYSPTGPQVLKDLTFTINSMEKVGIVGRTGAGKSSLVTTLFRLVEPTGKLKIDGIDIQTIGLQDLRTSISMIPQDPVLFTGSLRKNLDPFGANSDEVLWNALNEVKLKEQVGALPEGLDAEVSEGGVNFSVGQRQLICLARAVLTSNKILLIDEATANVDPITDELIQGTIRTKFRDCTVLTIAHRLHTIMDSDRVLVLDNGHIVEFDPPYDLLKQGEGYFYDMAQQTGKAEFDHLYDIARQAAHRNGKVLTLTNGISSKSTKPAEEHATDNTLRDIPSTLTSGENEDATYDISDIEDSLRIASSTTNVDDLKKEEEQEEKEEERVAILEDEIAEPLLPEAGAESRTLSSSPKNVPPLSEDVSGVSGGHEGATSDTSPLISQSGKPEKLGEGKEDKKASEKKDSEEEEEDEDDETTGEHEILLKFGSSHSLADDKKKGGGKDDDSSVIDV